MVTVSISEVYDLHTIVNKMSLIGIHSPGTDLIKKMYPGLCTNYKYFRIKSIDVSLSTAQTLPLSVGEIGLDANQIRPQDMMNPILYSAVSNDSWSTLEARLNGLSQGSIETIGELADISAANVTGLTDEHGAYYSLLASHNGFKIAHPQNGLRMNGLVPLLWQGLYEFGENGTNASTVPDLYYNDNTIKKGTKAPYMIRGRPVRFPRINTTVLTGFSPGMNDSGVGAGKTIDSGMYDAPQSAQIVMPKVPETMVGAIILPPVTATTGILYYRMVCRCWIEFTGVRPITDVTTFAEMSTLSSTLYHSDYAEQSSKMDATTDMVDVKNAEIEKIMEGK